MRRKPETTASFVRHLEPLQRVLEAYCRRSLRDCNEVADVLQSAIAKAFRDYHEFAEGTNFRAWIFRYVSLEILNRNRTALRSRPAGLLTDVADDDAPLGMADDAAAAQALLRSPERILDDCDQQLAEAIALMPPLERSIFLLRAIADLTYREIAEILEVPMGTVMGLLSRGRKRLREKLAEYAGSQGLIQARKAAEPEPES